jgi:cytochrome c-type biogenesis protein CcmE
MWGKALWRLYKILVTIGIAIIIALIAFSISMFDLNAQSSYFHIPQSDIERVGS